MLSRLLLSRSSQIWIICLIGSLICLGLMAAKSKLDAPDRHDSRQYIAAGYNLNTYGLYSQSMADDHNITPGIGREPGFPLVLAAIYRLGLGGIEAATMACLATEAGCGVQPYTAVQWLNRIFFALAGVLLFQFCLNVTSSLKLATVAGASVWLNIKLQSSMDQIVSDPLALFLVCGFSFLLLKTGKTNCDRTRVGLAGAAGFCLSFLILTKAIFLYFFYLAVVFCGGLLLFHARKRIKSFLPAVLIFVLCAALLPALWIKRNGEVSGEYKITDSRAGIALSARNVFHDMTLQEYFTSFVYWFPGSGDNWSEKFIPEQHWIRFKEQNPDGFYLKGHTAFGENVARLSAEQGRTPQDAEQIWTTTLKNQVLSSPLTHALTTIPLFYRGVLADVFIAFSLPGMIFLVFWAIRHKDWILITAMSPAFFNLIFYPLISLNIARYQITAAPAFSMGLVFFCIMVQCWKKRKKQT